MTVPQASIPNLMLQGAERESINALDVVKSWLQKLQKAIHSNGADQRDALFLEDSWWRDIIALTWEIRSLHGNDISDCIKQAHEAKLSNFKPAESGALVPQVSDMGPFTLIESAFSFDTKIGSGKGYVRLANTGPSEWKAWIVMTNLQEIKGHEELYKLSAGPKWPAAVDDAKYETESQENPRVLVIGAGQSGLSLCARLKQLGVPTLLVDKLSHVGDSWRYRYMNLSLHDPIWENHMPYLRFPETFPTWIPRKDIADWLEHYQSVMKLPVSLESTVTGAKWDDAAKQWTVEIQRHGSTVSMHPAHIVMATGYHSDTGHIPDFEGLKDFSGPIIHSTKYTTVTDVPDWKSKKWIVVGSSASAHDVAYDIAMHGADVTMVQRDANMAYSLNSKVHVVGAPYVKPGISTEDADVLASSMPFPVAISLMVGGTQMIYQMDKELLDRVGKTEFKFLKGDDGRGILHLILQKGGGHYPDQGSLELIADGRIKVKQCYDGIQRLTPKGLVLGDGREVLGDAIIMATGYEHAGYTARKVLDEEIASKSSFKIKFNKQNELQSIYTSAGHPGLWYLCGSFALNRPGSRNLALQIKAVELGLNPDHYNQKLEV